MNINDFLLARISEDEALQHRFPHNKIAARVLAECKAKRFIVSTCLDPDPVLDALAEVYADHPDYPKFRAGWGSTTIPLTWSKPPLTGNRTRGNPYARANEVKNAKGQAIVAVARVCRTKLAGANVTLHFRPADKRRRDADGMFPTLKVCLDALVLQGVLPDDSWVHVPRAACEIHPPNGEPASMWLTLDDPDRELT